MRQLLSALVVAIVAGLVLLAVEYSWFNPRPAPPQAKTPPVTDSRTTPPPAAAPELPGKPASRAAEELQALRQTARRITSSVVRDQELTTVARMAAEQKQYRFAVEVARDITSSTTRDKALEFVACYALNQSDDRPAADAAVRALTSSPRRDELYRAIIARTARKDQSNDVSCPKL
jgi:hypothetical protein